jgi:hypothetical protein
MLWSSSLVLSVRSPMSFDRGNETVASATDGRYIAITARSSPSARLNAAIWTLRLFSETQVSGQMRAISSSLPTTSPECSTSACNSSRSRAPRLTVLSPSTRSCRSGISLNGPNENSRPSMDTVLIRHTSELASLAVAWEHPIRLLPIFIHSVTVNRAPLRHVGAWARAAAFRAKPSFYYRAITPCRLSTPESTGFRRLLDGHSLG